MCYYALMSNQPCADLSLIVRLSASQLPLFACNFRRWRRNGPATVPQIRPADQCAGRRSCRPYDPRREGLADAERLADHLFRVATVISEEKIDFAVKRLFTARMKLGMFDPPGDRAGSFRADGRW